MTQTKLQKIKHQKYRCMCVCVRVCVCVARDSYAYWKKLSFNWLLSTHISADHFIKEQLNYSLKMWASFLRSHLEAIFPVCLDFSAFAAEGQSQWLG